MAELITEKTRKAIKKIAQVSQCARALSLMPTAEDFALMLIGDMRIIARRINNISVRINDILDRYTSIPSEFLLKGFDEILEKLDDINDYAKFAIAETTDVMSSSLESVQSMVDGVGSAVSSVTSATLQIGGGLAYGTIAMGANITLAMTGDGRTAMVNSVVKDVVDGDVSVGDMKDEFNKRIDNSVGDMNDVANGIRNWTETAAKNSTESIDEFFDGAGKGISDAMDWVDGVKNSADGFVDDTVGELIKYVENAKREVEEKIERVRKIFDNLTKNFDESFGFLNGKNFAEDVFRNASNTAKEMNSDSPIYDALGEVTEEVADFIKNFNIGKVVTAIGGLVIGAGAATLAMELLPSIDIDRMLKDVVGGVDTYRLDKMTELYNNKYYEDSPDLVEIPDCPWQLSVDDLDKYNADGYNKWIEKYADEHNAAQKDILDQISKVETSADLDVVTKANEEEMKKHESALKAMRKVRRDAIKARMVERYRGFLQVELDYLKKECNDMKISIKNDWDAMMTQYKVAIDEITKFFTTDGSGGNETIDRCCDRINDDATQIVELCKGIGKALTNAVAMVPTPYAIGGCIDMPVHKVLAFIKDIQIILTFVRNLIRLGVDIISQLTILVKIISAGINDFANIMKLLKDIIGIDTILSMIDYLISLFKPKIADAKMLLENAISPIYYNETEDYERRINDLESIISNLSSGTRYVNVEMFKYSDDPYAIKKHKEKSFGGLIEASEDETLEEKLDRILNELEEKGEREVVAYRSPILNESGDDFAGWIYYHANAYDNMYKGWSENFKRGMNKLIKNASKKNKMKQGKLLGGVAQLKKNMDFGYYTESGEWVGYSVTGFDAYYWYTKWTNDPVDCEPDYSNIDSKGNAINKDVVSPVQTTSNGSLVELSDGRRVFVEGKVVKSGDYVNVEGKKYRVK
jgi:hypothetical protein